MGLEVGKHFLELAKELVGLGSTIQKAKLEQRLRLAQYLESVAACLTGIAEVFLKGKPASELCGELEEYASTFSAVCEGLLADADVKRLQRILADRVRARSRSLLFIAGIEGARAPEVASMTEAAGRLRGVANSLKV